MLDAWFFSFLFFLLIFDGIFGFGSCTLQFLQESSREQEKFRDSGVSVPDEAFSLQNPTFMCLLKRPSLKFRVFIPMRPCAEPHFLFKDKRGVWKWRGGGERMRLSCRVDVAFRIEALRRYNSVICIDSEQTQSNRLECEISPSSDYVHSEGLWQGVSTERDTQRGGGGRWSYRGGEGGVDIYFSLAFRDMDCWREVDWRCGSSIWIGNFERFESLLS